jgi:predicted NBD/HSP70 family sugar kinase
MPLPAGTPEDVLRRISGTIDDLARGVWVGAGAAAIGVSMPGLVNPATGTGASLANLPGWDNVDVASALGGAKKTPVALENDANAAATGEGWRGAARGLRHFVFVAYGTGIGAGVVIDGSVYRGARGLAGEVGFMPMTRADMRSGDWHNGLEGAAGGGVIAATAARLLGEGGTPARLFDAAAAGEPEAVAWLAATQEYVAMALADTIAVLDPEMIVMGGGVSMAQAERFLAPMRDMVHARGPHRTPIVLSELGADAQIIGALKLAIDRLAGA